MFSQQEIANFRAFGFVLLPGLLDPHEATALRDEVASCLTDAYGGLGRDPDEESGGIRGDYLPLSVDRAPRSQALIADDPRLFQG